MPEARTSLLAAVRGGDGASVRRLAAESPGRLDEAGPDGRTPLMVAAAAGAEEMVALLLELGADAARRGGKPGRPAAKRKPAGAAPKAGVPPSWSQRPGTAKPQTAPSDRPRAGKPSFSSGERPAGDVDMGGSGCCRRC